MIEQATLLKLARDFAARKAVEQSSLKAIVLTGSVARGEVALGDAVDLDLLLISDLLPEHSREILRLSDNVFIDATYVAASTYTDKKAVRIDHFLSSMLNDALILHDPRHYFDILQASVRAPYNRPDHIYARARAAYNAAMQRYDPLSFYREDPPEAVTPELLTELRAALYLCAYTLLPLMNQSQASGPRKIMVRFEAAARELNAELYVLFLQALGVSEVGAPAIEGWVNDWAALYKAAAPKVSDEFCHPLKRGYYDRGYRALIQAGHALNILWAFEETLSACGRGLATPPELWTTYLNATHKDTPQGFAERVRVLETLLNELDQTLIRWADREGLEH